MLFCSNSAHFSEIQLVCDRRRTDGRTDGRTHPLLEMRERIYKNPKTFRVILGVKSNSNALFFFLFCFVFCFDFTDNLIANEDGAKRPTTETNLKRVICYKYRRNLKSLTPPPSFETCSTQLSATLLLLLLRDKLFPAAAASIRPTFSSYLRR